MAKKEVVTVLQRKNKALERLEQALIEDEEDEYEEEYDDDYEDEETYEAPQKRTSGTSCLGVLALMLMTAIVFMLLLFTLKMKGII